MNPLSWSFRRLYFLAVAACFGSVAYALYVQYGMLMQPCPLCILQRVVFLAMGVFFLAGAIHNPGAFGRKVYAALVGLSAIAEALRILATRIAAHTDVVRMATTPRPHLQAVSGDAKGKCSPTKSTPPANGMGPRWDYPK